MWEGNFEYLGDCDKQKPGLNQSSFLNLPKSWDYI